MTPMSFTFLTHIAACLACDNAEKLLAAVNAFNHCRDANAEAVVHAKLFDNVNQTLLKYMKFVSFHHMHKCKACYCMQWQELLLLIHSMHEHAMQCKHHPTQLWYGHFAQSSMDATYTFKKCTS